MIKFSGGKWVSYRYGSSPVRICARSTSTPTIAMAYITDDSSRRKTEEAYGNYILMANADLMYTCLNRIAGTNVGVEAVELAAQMLVLIEDQFEEARGVIFDVPKKPCAKKPRK